MSMRKPSGCKNGQNFDRGNITNRIVCADAITEMQSWPDHCVDVCITDPPYNIAKTGKGLAWAFSSHVTMASEWDQFKDRDYALFTQNWLEEVCRITKKNGNIFVFGSYHNMYLIGAIAQKLRLRIINSIIWAKPNAQPNITCRMFTESTEQIIWLCNNTEEQAKGWTFNYSVMKAQNGGKQMRNFWQIPTAPAIEKKFGKHPSQKPLMLMERIVLAATNSKDLVLDCFSGAGSTLVACKKLGRSYIGIEQDETYCKIASQRLEEIQLDRPLRSNLVERHKEKAR